MRRRWQSAGKVKPVTNCAEAPSGESTPMRHKCMRDLFCFVFLLGFFVLFFGSPTSSLIDGWTRASTSFWHPKKKKEREGRKEKKERAGNNFKFMPPTNLQQKKKQKQKNSDLLLVLHNHDGREMHCHCGSRWAQWRTRLLPVRWWNKRKKKVKKSLW